MPQLSFSTTRRATLIASLLLLGVLSPEPAMAAVQFRGGLNLAKTSYDPEPPSEIETPMGFGPSMGALIDAGKETGPHFLFGVMYDSRPAKLEDNDNGDKAELKAGYVALPMMLSLRSPAAKEGGQGFFNVGVEPAFNISKEVETNDGDGEGEVNAFDFGLRVEAGISVPTGNGNAFLLGAGYTHGLTNYLGASDDTGVEGFHRVFRIFAGFTLASL